MSDYISRENLINDIENVLWDWDTVDGITATTVLKQTITDIRNQPAADVTEIKHGYWTNVDGARCSLCNYKLETTGLPTFCPNCGAKMEVE